jgi:hypothetical protein
MTVSIFETVMDIRLCGVTLKTVDKSSQKRHGSIRKTLVYWNEMVATVVCPEETKLAPCSTVRPASVHKGQNFQHPAQ